MDHNNNPLTNPLEDPSQSSHPAQDSHPDAEDPIQIPHDHHLDLQNAINALNPSDIPPHLHPALNVNVNPDGSLMNVAGVVGVDGLPEEMGEQMELFWGAVSSAFGNAAGAAGGDGEGEGERRDEEEVEGAMEGEEGMEVDQTQAEGQGQDQQEEGQPQGDGNPRNEWEHVQLLMSLGGQLGEDLASGINAQEGGNEGEVRLAGMNGEEDLQAEDGQGMVEGARRPDGAIGDGSGNAEAGPSNYQTGNTGIEDPSGKKGKKSRRTSMKPKGASKSGNKSSLTGDDAAAAAATKARNLLTLEERKANHVSSEQRRRNAIRIGYAELGALEHLSVNGVWPVTGELAEVVEASKGMEGMEELVGRKRRRSEVEGEGGVGLGEGDAGETGAGGNTADSQTLAEGESDPTAVAPAVKKKKLQLRSKKGMSFENAKEPVSKSTILQKAADLAQWMTLGNEWLAGEVARLERILDVPAGAELDLPQSTHSDEIEQGNGHEAGYAEMDGQEGQEPVQAEQVEHDSGDADIQAVQQAVAMAEEQTNEPRIEDHFVQANGQYRETEELGPDGYPRDMY